MTSRLCVTTERKRVHTLFLLVYLQFSSFFIGHVTLFVYVFYKHIFL